MKVVIQCSATKNKPAGSFSVSGRRVAFVAHPEFCPRTPRVLFRRPDDFEDSIGTTWRNYLVSYNESDQNSHGLLPASKLYSPSVYSRLVNHVGIQNLYVLSAGWGLIRSTFLLPDYDITFSPQAKMSKRRTKQDPFQDYSHLSQSDIKNNETIYFFGGKDYLPLFCTLTRSLHARKVVYFTSRNIVKESGFEYKRYRTPGTNWHYRCAQDFINRTVRR